MNAASLLNFDGPGLFIALLALLIGLRLAILVSNRLSRRTAVAVAPTLAPDEAVDGEITSLGAPDPQADSEPMIADIALPSRTHFFAELLDSAIIAVVLVGFLIRPFVLQAFYIPSGSMVPTLLQGDKLVATKFTYHLREPKHGEVVVFHAPKLALQLMGQTYDAQHPTDYVKRVVGLPHDRIRIVSGVGIYRNGKLLKEPYDKPDYDFPVTAGDLLAVHYEARSQLLPHIVGRELVVPEGYLFVLGDNRTQSHDGHIWGLLPRNQLVGKALFIFWPLYRGGLVH